MCIKLHVIVYLITFKRKTCRLYDLFLFCIFNADNEKCSNPTNYKYFSYCTNCSTDDKKTHQQCHQRHMNVPWTWTRSSPISRSVAWTCSTLDWGGRFSRISTVYEDWLNRGAWSLMSRTWMLICLMADLWGVPWSWTCMVSV